MRLLVCGDRNWTDKEAIKTRLRYFKPDVVIHGKARGVDRLAGEAAEELGIPVIAFPAEWKKYGLAAGPIRNQQMLNEGQPNHVAAFHTDIENSKGTKDMVTRARKAGIPTVVFDK